MSSSLEQLQYGFDRNSRRTWRQRATTQGWDNAYVYDQLSQVIGDDRGDLNQAHNAIAGIPANGSRWQYDETGNWHGYETLAGGAATLNQARTHDKGNRLMEVSDAAAMRTDRAGRMLETVPGPEGDWSSGYQISWDAWNRITNVATAAGPVAAYAYDGLARRITRYTNMEDVTLHSYYNDDWRPLEERKNSESTAALSYLWGARHRDDLVRRDRAVGGTMLNEGRYVLMDYFSPAAITDESGDVTERYQFSAFGLRTILNSDFTVRSTSECAMEFSFQGQFEDTETGWLNYGYRYYLPGLGRWACKDPIAERGGPNLYATVENDIINEVDFLGKDKVRSDGTLGNAKNRGDVEPRAPQWSDNITPPFGPKNGDKVDNKEWYDRNRGDEIRTAIQQFQIEIDREIKSRCRERPTTVSAPQSRSLLPRNVIEGNYVNGTAWMNVRGIEITWNCEKFSWTAEMYISDGVGFDSDPKKAGWFERNVQEPIWGWLFPARDVERGEWPMNSEGSCY